MTSIEVWQQINQIKGTFPTNEIEGIIGWDIDAEVRLPDGWEIINNPSAFKFVVAHKERGVVAKIFSEPACGFCNASKKATVSLSQLSLPD